MREVGRPEGRPLAEQGERQPSTGVVILYELLIYMVLAHQRERQSQKGSHVQVVRSSTSFVSTITSPETLNFHPFLFLPHPQTSPSQLLRTMSAPDRYGDNAPPLIPLDTPRTAAEGGPSPSSSSTRPKGILKNATPSQSSGAVPQVGDFSGESGEEKNGCVSCCP